MSNNTNSFMLTVKINKLLFAFLFFFSIWCPSAHTWLLSNAHKYENIKDRGGREKKAEEKEYHFVIYQDRSIDNSI